MTNRYVHLLCLLEYHYNIHKLFIINVKLSFKLSIVSGSVFLATVCVSMCFFYFSFLLCLYLIALIHTL